MSILKRIKMPSSLTTLLTLAFLVFGIVALFLFGGLQLFFYIKSQHAAISGRQRFIVQDAALRVSDFIDDKFRIMTISNWLQDPINLKTGIQKQFLESILGIEPSFRHLIFMNADKEILSQASRLSSDASKRLEDRIKQLTLIQNLHSGKYISSVDVDPVTSEPMLIISVPIMNVFQVHQGTMIGEVNLKFMWDLVDRLEVGKTGKAYVVDRQGYLIAFGDTARVLRIENVGRLEPVREFMSKPASAPASAAKTYSGITGEIVVGTYSPLGMPDWAVVAEIPWNEAYREVIRNVAVTIGIFLAISALASILGVYIAHRLTSPIENLTKTATRIAMGAPGLLAEISGPKEVAVLATAFNSMTTQLRQSFTNLELQLGEVKKAQEALRQSEQRLLTLAEASFEGIVISKQGIIEDLNSQQAQMLGYNREEMIGTPLLNYVAAEHSELVAESVAAGRLEPYEHMAMRRDGTVFPVEARARSMDSGNQQIRITAIRDITEQKKAAETLRASEERMRNIIDNASEVIFTVSPEGIFTFVSPAWTRFLGHPVTEIQGRSFTSLVHPEDVPACEAFLKKVLSTGHSEQGLECRVKHQDGSWRWFVSIGSSVTDPNGKPLYIVGIGQDITWNKQAAEEKEKLEAQLFQAQKMESIGRLAGGVAHDFNNMLNVILGYTQLIKLDSPADSTITTEINEIEKAAGKAKDITRQLLAFSRKQIISPRSLNINDQIRDNQQTLARLIGEDINLRFIPEKDIWNIRLDPTQLDQIIYNLAINARDAMPEGGNLTIETANTVIDDSYCREHPGFEPGSYVLMAVSDDGIGMDKEIQSHVFEPFFTTKDTGKGTGLGLATIYGSVKQNGGFINFYSEPGQGTTFRIYFQRDMEDAEVFEKAEEAEVLSGTGTILLVEDNEMVRAMTKISLEKIGYTVLVPATPMEALSLCENGDTKIDLLITDVIMPVMNGTELRDRVKEVRPEIRVLFMSGYTSNTIVHHGVLNKDVNFIQKPWNINELARKVREVIKDKSS